MSESAPIFRYQFQDPIIVDGEETYGLWNPPWFIKRPDLLKPSQIITMVVPNGFEGRPDLIAGQVYNSQYLDWVIIAFNSSLDVLNWPRAGTTIKLPTLDVVLPYVN